jgi:type II secretory pathway pseudopilin PulG
MPLERNAGFTLLETLVAFVIAATSLGLLYQVHSNATTTSALAGEYLVATELAESVVAELAETEKAVAFARSGVADEKYRWTVRAAALPPPIAEAEAREQTARFQLREVSVEIEWRSRERDRHIELHTVKPFFPEGEP